MASQQLQMTDMQKVAIGATLHDEDGQAYTELPAGVTVTFKSSDENVCYVVVRPDGMTADVTSDRVGTATITAHVEGLDVGNPIEDETVEITVVNTEPGSLNLSVGSPEPE